MTKTERSYSQKNSAHRELVSALARLMRILNTYKLLAVPSPTVLVKGHSCMHVGGPACMGCRHASIAVWARGGAAWLQANQLKRACPKGKWQGAYPSPSAQSSLHPLAPTCSAGPSVSPARGDTSDTLSNVIHCNCTPCTLLRDTSSKQPASFSFPRPNAVISSSQAMDDQDEHSCRPALTSLT